MSSHEKDSVLKGFVWYMPKMALPPFAVLTVNLIDMSVQDVAALVLDSQSGPVNDQDLSFSLNYDSSQGIPGRDYAVEAKIEIEGRLWFSTNTHHCVKLDGTDEQPIYLRVDMV